MGINSLGDDVGSRPRPRPQPRRTSTDISMREEKGDGAEERRRQAVAEILERGRVMEERRKRRKLSEQAKEQPASPTFDALVNKDGTLLQDEEEQGSVSAAHSSGVETTSQSSNLRQRPGPTDADEPRSTLHQSVEAPLSLRQLDHDQASAFESRYEQEMREAWNFPLSSRRVEMPSSHASESLIEFTPTTESAPDPDFSIPSASDRPLDRSEYFSAAASSSTHTLSDHESQASLPGHSTYLNRQQRAPARQIPASAASSLAGSVSDIRVSEAEESSDDVLSEIGDGIRTPGSAWTDVDSTVSGDFQL